MIVRSYYYIFASMKKKERELRFLGGAGWGPVRFVVVEYGSAWSCLDRLGVVELGAVRSGKVGWVIVWQGFI